MPTHTVPASRLSRLHTCSARLRVKACSLGAASGLGTLERSKARAGVSPERVINALSSCRLTVTACCWQAALNREWISSAPLRPNRAFCWEQGIVTNPAQDPGPTGHSKLPYPGNAIRTTATGRGRVASYQLSPIPSTVTHEPRQAVRREAGAPELGGVRHTGWEGLSGTVPAMLPHPTSLDSTH